MSSLIRVSYRLAFAKGRVNGVWWRAKGFVSGISGSQSLGRFWCEKLFSLLIGVNTFVRGNFGRDLTWVGVVLSSLIEW